MCRALIAEVSDLLQGTEAGARRGRHDTGGGDRTLRPNRPRWPALSAGAVHKWRRFPVPAHAEPFYTSVSAYGVKKGYDMLSSFKGKGPEKDQNPAGSGPPSFLNVGAPSQRLPADPARPEPAHRPEPTARPE